MKRVRRDKKGKSAGVVGGAAISGAIVVGPGLDVRPTAVVTQDSSGQFKTNHGCLKGPPGEGIQERWVIYVKVGIHKEDVLVGKQHPNVFMYGDDPAKTIVTGNKNFHTGVQTSQTAPFNVDGINFFARGMGFQNTVGPEGIQVVALRVNAL